ncbi:hypothetical protein WR25_03670 [Diploscapter pachys]|uniref:Uncharacterized protein n=1 Tax=Diploscapter pachys TaxID=2018661 RepID=A0A2A2LD97_9BILA|nr:hypothetical protein WR25_03670 [Diploscapter pachys]
MNDPSQVSPVFHDVSRSRISQGSSSQSDFIQSHPDFNQHFTYQDYQGCQQQQVATNCYSTSVMPPYPQSYNVQPELGSRSPFTTGMTHAQATPFDSPHSQHSTSRPKSPLIEIIKKARSMSAEQFKNDFLKQFNGMTCDETFKEAFNLLNSSAGDTDATQQMALVLCVVKIFA